MNTFGDERYKKQKCDILRFVLKGRDNTAIEITALSFPTICSDLPNKVHISRLSHLEGLELADESAVDGLDRPIDVSVGSDFYYRIITGDIVKGDSGPVAIGSIFGYLLSGPTNHLTYDDGTHLNSNIILQEAMTLFLTMGHMNWSAP